MSPPDHSASSPPDESVQTTDLHELTANGSPPHTQKVAGQFTTTHWSVVVEAQGESPAAQEALEKLCCIYWRPIYSFVQRQGTASQEPEDVTQAFFADLLEHKSLTAVRKEKGRFRSYLLGALKYFLADERRRAMAIKRGKGHRLIPLEELRADERAEMEPTDPVTAEQIYERRWAATVLERVLGLLKNKYVAAGNARLFDSLKQLLPDEPGAPSQADIAAQLGMSANTLRQAFYRFRQRYQSLLREEIAQTVATPGDYVTIDSNGRLGRSNLNGSSRRFKHDIQPMDKASDVIFALKPVSFRYNKEYDATQRLAFGLIAEEVAEVAPDLVGHNKQGEPDSVRYEQINAMLLNEFLKEHKKVEKLETVLEAVNKRLKEHDAKIEEVSARVKMNGTVPRTVANK